MQILIGNADVTERYKWQDVTTDDTDGTELDVCRMTADDALAAEELLLAAQDDFAEASHNGYATGRMYVDAVARKDGDTIVFARGIPAAGREKAWAVYENVTLMELLHLAARELNMGYAQYGMEDQRYGRLVRRNETWAEFLQRILRMEGAALKYVGGKLTAISILWAQQQAPVKSFEITASTGGCLYREEYAGYRTCTVSGMGIEGKATDTTMPGSRNWRPDYVPENGRQAKRWAAGELLHINRMSSVLIIDHDFTPTIAALSRVDIYGLKGIAGEWIASRVTQDFIRKRTRMYLRRCIKSIV